MVLPEQELSLAIEQTRRMRACHADLMTEDADAAHKQAIQLFTEPVYASVVPWLSADGAVFVARCAEYAQNALCTLCEDRMEATSYDAKEAVAQWTRQMVPESPVQMPSLTPEVFRSLIALSYFYRHQAMDAEDRAAADRLVRHAAMLSVLLAQRTLISGLEEHRTLALGLADDDDDIGRPSVLQHAVNSVVHTAACGAGVLLGGMAYRLSDETDVFEADIRRMAQYLNTHPQIAGTQHVTAYLLDAGVVAMRDAMRPRVQQSAQQVIGRVVCEQEPGTGESIGVHRLMQHTATVLGGMYDELANVEMNNTLATACMRLTLTVFSYDQKRLQSLLSIGVLNRALRLVREEGDETLETGLRRMVQVEQSNLQLHALLVCDRVADLAATLPSGSVVSWL